MARLGMDWKGIGRTQGAVGAGGGAFPPGPVLSTVATQMQVECCRCRGVKALHESLVAHIQPNQS